MNCPKPDTLLHKPDHRTPEPNRNVLSRLHQSECSSDLTEAVFHSLEQRNGQKAHFQLILKDRFGHETRVTPEEYVSCAGPASLRRTLSADFSGNSMRAF
jgi:hypothetical protein